MYDNTVGFVGAGLARPPRKAADFAGGLAVEVVRAHVLRWAYAMVAGLSSACLVPPDGTLEPIQVTSPPEIRLDTVRPIDAIVNVADPEAIPLGCTSFRVSADIVDRDSDVVQVRFVANNGIRFRAKHIQTRDDHPASGAARAADTLVDPVAHFDAPRIGQPHIVSIFVTDAPRFAVSATVTDALDYGEIVEDPDDNGVIDYSLVEYRWVINFVDRRECPPR